MSNSNELVAGVPRLAERMAALDDAVTGEVSQPIQFDPNVYFAMRVTFGINDLCVERMGLMLAEARGDVAEYVLKERRADFQDATSALYTTLEAILDQSLAILRREGNASPKGILASLEQFREAALLASVSLQTPATLVAPVFLQNRKPGWLNMSKKEIEQGDLPTIKHLHALHFHSLYTRLATQAIALHLTLTRLLDRNEKKTGHAARVSRYRRRKRRRVAAVVTMEVYEDDLELLKRFGYLSALPKAGSDTESDFTNKHFVTPETIGDAVQAFLLNGFLTHIEVPGYPWAERVKRQRRRISALTEAKSDGDSEE